MRLAQSRIASPLLGTIFVLLASPLDTFADVLLSQTDRSQIYTTITTTGNYWQIALPNTLGGSRVDTVEIIALDDRTFPFFAPFNRAGLRLLCWLDAAETKPCPNTNNWSVPGQQYQTTVAVPPFTGITPRLFNYRQADDAGNPAAAAASTTLPLVYDHASLRISKVGGSGVTFYGTSTMGYFVVSGQPGPAPMLCTQNCFSNVLFLPGIESSRLYRPQVVEVPEQKLWEPLNNGDVQDLFMSADGSSAHPEIYTKIGDVLDELPTGKNIYLSFISKMDDLKDQGHINDWQPMAYDWRLSLDDILAYGNEVGGKLYYSGNQRATSTPYVIQELRRLAGSSKSGKVTVIAHSNGGLLAKQLTEVLGAEASDLIDKMIFVAVPQAGTPMAVAAGLHGYDQGLPADVISFILSEETVRTFASTSPMFYQLLPSANYFTYVDDPVVTFDASLTDWIARYGNEIHSGPALHQFLTDTYGRGDSQTGDKDQPIQMSDSLLSAAETLHANLDNWVPPTGIDLIQIAGWGVPTTVSGITYKQKGAGVKPEANFTIDGDGTVVVPSALWSAAAGAVNYWANIYDYNKHHPIATLGGLLSFGHADILEIQELLSFISDTVTNELSPISNYSYLTTESPSFPGTRLRYSLHSPLTLDLFDNQGRHTGISTTTGQVEEQIPGTYYTEFGDVKYLFTDATSSLHITMDGYETGTFTFRAEQLRGDTVVASSTWKDMPTTPDTIVSIETSIDLSEENPLLIDKNGDGIVEHIVVPKLDDTVVLPKPKLTLTTANKTMMIGGVIPPLTWTLSGFVGDDTPSSNDVAGSARCSTTATSASLVGIYPITCTIGTLTSHDYEFTEFVAGTLKIEYLWTGFLQPIDDPTINPALTPSVFKGGSTVPVKFQLKNTAGTPIQSSASPVWITPVRLSPLNAPVDEPVYAVAGTSGTSYRWDGTSQQYIYNWSTKGLMPGYWYRIYAQLEDGKTYSVIIGLR